MRDHKIKIMSPFEKPLLLCEAKLSEIASAYLRHEAGEKIDLSALAAVNQEISSRQSGGHGYTIQDGVAVLDADGVLDKGMNIFMAISGGTSTEYLRSDLAHAAANPDVKSAILRIDSPGGTTDGIQLVANAVAEFPKTIVAWVTGMAMSGGYYIASQADQIVLADELTYVGSIGVVIAHVDRSKADEQKGVKRTEITAGKYKRLPSDTGPISDEGRDVLQSRADEIYAVFLKDVGAGRNMTADQVHADMGDGRWFMGQAAINAGLADSIATLDQVIAQLNADATDKLQNPGAKAPITHSTGESTMFTQEQLDAAKAEAHAQGVVQGKTEGATAELARIKGIAALQMPGHGALIKTMMFDGTTTPEAAAVKLVNAHQESLTKAGVDLEKDASAVASASGADTVAEGKQQVQTSGEAAKPKEVDPIAHSKAITARIAKAKSEGRTINAVEADAEIAAEAAAAK